MGSATGHDTLSFSRIDLALPDPGGRYLLVHGKWKFDPGRTSGSGRGFVVIDMKERTTLKTSLFKMGSPKGWWSNGNLLMVRPTHLWEEGGGGRIQSDSIAGTAFTVDVRTGEANIAVAPTERYFGPAGFEDGHRIFLAADWTWDKVKGTTRFRFTEYRDSQKGASFEWKLKGFHPLVRSAELTPDGTYWVLIIEWPPRMAAIYKGTHYGIVIFSRDGKRWRIVKEKEEQSLVFLQVFESNDMTVISCLRDINEPSLQTWRMVVH